MFFRSWQLDATEGPARIRKRLQRCHLNIGRKYLLPGAQRKLGEFCFMSSQCMREVSASEPCRTYDRQHDLHAIMCTGVLISP